MDILNNAHAAERILNLACQSIFILLLGWLFTRILKHKAPTMRSGVILLTIAASMVLPFLNFTSLSKEIISYQTELPITVWAYANPADNPQNAAYLYGEYLENDGQNPALLTQKSRIKSLFSPSHVIRFLNGFGLAWGIGFLALLAHFLYGIASLRSFKKELLEIPDQRVNFILENAKKSFPKPIRTQVFLSKKILSPLATGIFRPLIVLPFELYKRLSDAEIKGILLHELSHIYHKDQITGILQRLVTALNWWNPFAHTLSADYSRAREEISDNHVLLENNAKEYAECLINLAEKTSLFSRLPVITGMASTHIPLKERIKNILSKERIMETKLKKSTLSVIVLAAVVTIGIIAGHRITFASPDQEIRPEPIVLPENEVMSEDKVAEPVISPQEQEKEKTKKVEKPPKLIKSVDPEYPDEARKKGLEDAVVVEATTDKQGNVVKVDVLRGKYDILNQAAIEAVKQWKYEPMVLEGGESIGITFTVTCRFKLDEKSKKDIIKLPQDKKPILLKEVEPIYPEEARKAGQAGEVTIEAIIDEEGNVTDVKVIEGEFDILNKAAVDAVKQWKYEPYKIDGVAKKVKFTVEVRFKLR